MKAKLLLMVSLILLGILTIQAQTTPFVKGDKVLNCGFGIGTYSLKNYKVKVPPIFASFEYGILPMFKNKGVLGLGAFIEYAGYKKDYSSYDYETVKHFTIGVRGNVHFPLVDKLDTYASLLVGNHLNYFKYHNYLDEELKSKERRIAMSLLIGGRYYFNENLAAMAELGLGITAIRIGAAWKF
jgi:hypothetical protein